MKRRTISGLLLGLAATASAEAFAAPSASAGTAHGGGRGFERFLRRYEAANTAFQNGDPTLWLSLTAEKDPVSIFGGFGGLGEAGVATVHQRYLLAATRVPAERRHRRLPVHGQGRAWRSGLHGGDRAVARALRGGTPSCTTRFCG